MKTLHDFVRRSGGGKNRNNEQLDKHRHGGQAWAPLRITPQISSSFSHGCQTERPDHWRQTFDRRRYSTAALSTSLTPLSCPSAGKRGFVQISENQQICPTNVCYPHTAIFYIYVTIFKTLTLYPSFIKDKHVCVCEEAGIGDRD